ncbi:MAG: sensor histidine kinase [Acidobacteriota bacterium]
MEVTARNVLLGLRWFFTAEDGTATVRGSGGEALACTLSPPLGEAIRSAVRGRSPVAVDLDVSGMKIPGVLLLPAPGRDDLALGIEPTECQRVMAPEVESLVNQIAHDIRNHALTIGLQAEMGLRRASGASDLSGHFEAALRQVESLKGYLDQLLLFGREVRLAPVRLDPVAFIRDQVQRLQFSRPPDSPPLSVTVDAGSALGTVCWDATALGHALRAILDNAARSADPPPPIEIALRPLGEDRIALAIRDHGPGIPAAVLPRLAVPMTVRRAGGAGLGLAIARKMVAAHAGTLAVETGGGGTTVRLELPREARSD